MALVAESTRLVQALSRSLSDEVSTSQGVLKGVTIGGKVRGVRISSKRRDATRDVGIVATLDREGAVRRMSTLLSVNSLSRGLRGESVIGAAVKTAVEEEVPLFLLEGAFEKDYVPEGGKEKEKSSGNLESKKESKKKDKTGPSTVLSSVKLENVSKTYKNVQVLKDVSWEVKRGERVGLVGINGAGKTTQLNIIAGKEEPDSGNVVKARANMKIAFLRQEFEVVGSRTLREEFMSTFASEMDISARMEKVQVALENATDMDQMAKLLDELDILHQKAEASDLYNIDVSINKMMPELGFTVDDADRLVTSFSGGWQMRIALGKILLQEPDLLLLDEPTNHLDLDSIEWLERFMKDQDVPMVIVSHDRAFLDQLCTKIVETVMGVAQTFPGNYSGYVLAKAAWVEAQRMA